MKKYAGLCFIGMVALAAIAGCNPPADYALVGSAYLPASHGDIHIEKIDKEQILVVIAMDHLPPPAEVESGLSHYVVWFNAVGEYPELQQALEYDAENQTGRASIATSMREFDLQISVEPSERPAQPSDLLVASQKIREK